MAKPSEERRLELLQGTLDMLILKSLSLAPMHGFGITQRIEQISKGVFRVNAGSLLLAFQRLERADIGPPHASSSRAIAPARRAHSRFSTSSCARPFFVSE